MSLFMKFLSTKHEIRNPKQYQMTEIQMTKMIVKAKSVVYVSVLYFEHLIF